MTTVVTGGSGFIGSHLVRRLLDDGREVAVVSEFSNLDTGNLSGLGVQSSRIDVRKSDLTDYSQALTALQGAETVFHLAARIGNLNYLHGTELAELAALQTNLMIDTNVLRACLRQGVRTVVYASSVAVYAMDSQYSTGAVLTEDSPITANPDGGYGWAKLLGEVQLGWMKGIRVGIARIFNIYGENEPLDEDRAHVVGDLVRKVILNSDGVLEIRGDGRQSRDFLYVTDCIDSLLRLEESASQPPTIANIGSGQAISIGTLAERIVAVSGKNMAIKYDPAQPMDPVSRTASVDKAKAVLGWQPTVTLEDGIERTYRWAQRRLGSGT